MSFDSIVANRKFQLLVRHMILRQWGEHEQARLILDYLEAEYDPNDDWYDIGGEG